METGRKRQFAGLTRDTFLLALASLFGDISTEMLYPILPVFLTQVLLAPASVVGIVEGVATATQNIVQAVSGWLADKLRRYKRIALVGYGLAAVAKPLMGFASVWPQVLGARFLDRLGSGTRSAPRDALIAGSADERHRGTAFGLEGFGDNLGAFVGPLLAVGLLFAVHAQIRLIFLLAFIPGALAVVMIALVAAKPAATQPAQRDEPRGALFAGLPPAYWTYIGVTAVFGIGNSTNAFLILRAKQIGISLEVTILIYAGFNLVAALISYPAGRLSDALGRKGVLLFTFAVFAITYASFAITSNAVVIGAAFVLYGLHSGMYRAVGKALATDYTPPRLRASGIGWYAATVGLSGLVASVVAGQLWTAVSPRAVFVYGLVFAVLGAILLMILVRGAATE
ncbi:MAG TPA: MFS transporter [Ktedonobacterales bacterium]